MRRGLSLDDFSDRELVALVASMGDADGWVTVEAVARQVGLTGKHVQSIPVRFGWMKRYGILERTTKGPRFWRLTEAGREMASAQLPATLTNLLRDLKDAQLVFASHSLAGKFQTARDEHATMTRRELEREIRRRRQR